MKDGIVGGLDGLLSIRPVAPKKGKKYKTIRIGPQDEYKVYVFNHETGHVSLDHTFYVPMNSEITVRLVKVEGNYKGVNDVPTAHQEDEHDGRFDQCVS